MTKIGLAAAIACGVMFASGAFATEGGGGAYPNGAEDFMTGALPPPGDYMITYGLYYTADEFKDGPPDFNLDVGGAVFRYIHVTPIELLGGNWAQQIFVPALYVDVKAAGMSDDKFGLGDIIIDPIVISWHAPPFHCAAGLDTYVPVGAYDQNDLANIGRNYWTFEPVFAVTYLGQSGLELSAKFMYDFNMKNEDTDYESGDEFHVDYAAGYGFGEGWKAGLNGFYYNQLSSDEAPQGTPTMGEGEQMGLGPAVSYQWGKTSLVLKWQKEFDTESRPEGDRFWLKAICPL
jgi:hypothetical protein